MKSKLIIGLCFCLVNIQFTVAQEISWLSSIDWAKEIAQPSNKLIVIDFWASWCTPCRAMDVDVWMTDEIREMGRDFVYVKFDLSPGFFLANHRYNYKIEAVPTIAITDSWGKLIYKNRGTLSRESMKLLLSSFPSDVSRINEPLYRYHIDKGSISNNLDVAIAYQEYCDTLEHYAKRSFLNESYAYFRSAKKLCDRELDRDIIEKIEIHESLNLVYSGRGKSAIKQIKQKIGLDNIMECNKALAYYVLVKGYLQLDKEEEAIRHFADLKNCKGCLAYVESVKDNFEE